ncbi:glycosyl hydrolase family 18 protein [Sunxiuqinia sp. sy24]|uniref:glycosyl hydrolase family 18 protein n=1 Tax=Sunxiuqinia sp. sy24 TaxID=3461495 RepID=UPI0040460072
MISRLLLFFVLLGFISCDKNGEESMDEPDQIEIGKFDLVEVIPSYKQLKIRYREDNLDAEKLTVRWSQNSETLKPFIIPGHVISDTMEVVLDENSGFSDGMIRFTFQTSDKKGNTIKEGTRNIRVYGDKYISELKNRVILLKDVYKNTLSLQFEKRTNYDEVAISLTYTDIYGLVQIVRIASEDANKLIQIEGVDASKEIVYFSLFKPDAKMTDEFQAKAETFIAELDPLSEIDYTVRGDGSHMVVGYIRSDKGLEYLNDNYYDNLTHIIILTNQQDYSIADNGEIVPNDKLRNLFSEAISRREERKTKLYLGFGGGNERYMPLIADLNILRNYVGSIKDLCLEYGYDGVDIDWEHPETAEQKKAAGVFAKEMFEQLNPLNIELTQAIIWYNTGHMKAVENYLDFINVMIYDNFAPNYYHSPYDQYVTFVNNILDKGIAKEKVVAGLPFYGYNAVEDWGQKGGNAYFQILSEWDTKIGADVAYRDGQPVMSFDGVVKIWKKCAYALRKELPGVMIFEPWMDIPDWNSKSSLMYHVNGVFPVNTQGN